MKRRLLAVLTAMLTLALLLPSIRAEANGFATTAFIQPADLVAQQGFGFAMAADANIMAVGTQFAPFAVYVYVNNKLRVHEQRWPVDPAAQRRPGR